MNFILIGFIVLVVDMLYTIFEAVRGRKVDDEGIKKGKVNWLLAVPVFIGAVGAMLFGVYDLPIKDPIPMVREPDFVYFYMEDDDKNPLEKIEYSLNYDDTSSPQWTAYESDESIHITKSPTKIYYRTKFLWRTTDTQSQTAFIDDYGRVYLNSDFAPDITYKSISAEYNDRASSKGKKGNTYTGYEMTEQDFTVKGIDPNGIKHGVKGFTFSPTILQEGRNEIEVAYDTSSGQHLSDTVVVTAFEPKLLSIDAVLKDEYQQGVLVGTTLGTNMFDVTGTYENDEKKEITEFLVEPEEVLEEGEFEATINKDGVKDTVAIRAVTEFSAEEKETNDSIGSENKIGVNTSVSGTLSDEEDVDYYGFTLSGKGKAFLRFKHSKIDTTDVFWNVDLLTKNSDDPILSIRANGASAQVESSNIRLGPGTYYVRVSRGDSFDDREYVLSVQFEEEDDTYETEYNDSLDYATAIEVNAETPYTGNLSNQNDADYYKFSIAEKGKMRVLFSHAKKDNDYIRWRMRVMDNTDRELANIGSKGSESDVYTPSYRASPGEYYIKIERGDDWSNVDYQISVEYAQEGDEAETEPNDDYDIANKIANGQAIIGNIQSEHDTDIYEFDYDGGGDLELTFNHERFNNSNCFWKVRLYSKDSSEEIYPKKGYGSYAISGEDAQSVSCKWKDLSKTTYYIKVQKYNFSSRDYSLSVAW